MIRDEINAVTETPERAAQLNAPGALLKAALYYASVGWPVFPLVPGEKRPLTSNGFKDASLDMEEITAWWAVYPDANIGVPTGLRFDVIDIDTPDGYDSYETFRTEIIEGGHPFPDILAAAATGGGGAHVLVAATGRGNAAGLRPGLDYRGAGGYIVVPPSRLTDGRRYSWVRPPAGQLIGAGA